MSVWWQCCSAVKAGNHGDEAAKSAKSDHRGDERRRDIGVVPGWCGKVVKDGSSWRRGDGTSGWCASGGEMDDFRPEVAYSGIGGSGYGATVVGEVSGARKGSGFMPGGTSSGRRVQN